jgi:hypothetical protein
VKSMKSEVGSPEAEGKTRIARITTATRTECQYVLRRGLGTWEVTFEGRRDSFREEQGAEYMIWLLLHPPTQPIHATALVLEAGHSEKYVPEGAEFFQQRNLGLDDAEAVRNLRRQARELEAVLRDKRRGRTAKAEARGERRQILEFLRKNAWRSADSAQKCARAVARAIERLVRNLHGGVDAEGKEHPVLRDFAWHLREHLLIPSGRELGHGGARKGRAFGGCFTYEPPPGVVWRRD